TQPIAGIDVSISVHVCVRVCVHVCVRVCVQSDMGGVYPLHRHCTEMCCEAARQLSLREPSPWSGGLVATDLDNGSEHHFRYAFTLPRAACGGTLPAAQPGSAREKATAKGKRPFGAPRVKVPSPQKSPLASMSKRVILPSFTSMT